MIGITVDLTNADDEESLLAVRLIDIMKRYAAPALLDINVVTYPDLKPAIETLPANDDYVVDRLDFVTAGTRCSACKRPLTSGSAYIIKGPDGQEHPFGPKCISRKAPRYRDQIFPDLTRASKSLPSENETGEQGASRKTSIDFSATAEEEYLRLRFEKMAGFNIPAFEPLKKVYERYTQEGNLSDSDRQFVYRLLQNVSTKRPELSAENMQACYAFDHWLSESIKKLPEEHRAYLVSIQSSLRKRLYLTSGQVSGANKWLAKLEGMPELDPAPFAWAEKREKKDTAAAAEVNA